MPTVSNVIWSLDLSGYRRGWTRDEERAVETFLRAHRIEPSKFHSLFVRAMADGTRQLDVWLYERNDEGRIESCPHCPACAKMRHVVREVVAELPEVSTAWTPEGAGG